MSKYGEELIAWIIWILPEQFLELMNQAVYLPVYEMCFHSTDLSLCWYHYYFVFLSVH